MQLIAVVSMGNKVAPLQPGETALFAHLTNRTLLDPFSRFQFSFGQVPPTVAKNQQQTPLGIGSDTTSCLDKTLRGAELSENLLNIIRNHRKMLAILNFLQQLCY